MSIELPPGYQPSGDEEFMNPKQVTYFRRRLEETRASLQRELAASQLLEVEDDSSRDGDQTDHASADSEREFLVQNRERVQMLLRQTEQAIARIENGTYGYCDDTGEPIDLKRLMAQPATLLTVSAQEAREKRTG